jgi:hypothetical protein
VSGVLHDSPNFLFFSFFGHARAHPTPLCQGRTCHDTTRSGACVLLVKLNYFNLTNKGKDQTSDHHTAAGSAVCCCRFGLWLGLFWLGLFGLTGVEDHVLYPPGRVGHQVKGHSVICALRFCTSHLGAMWLEMSDFRVFSFPASSLSESAMSVTILFEALGTKKFLRAGSRLEHTRTSFFIVIFLYLLAGLE